MAPYNWNGPTKPPATDDSDPMDGYDDSAEPTVVAPTPTPAPAPVKAKTNVDKVVEELEDSPEVNAQEMSEVEWRLAKAQFYQMVINNQLIASDHPAAVAVEEELQLWAKEQLEVLMGIRQTTRASSEDNAQIQSALESLDKRIGNANLPFTSEEVDALKAVASRVLEKKAAAPEVKPAPVPVPTKPTPIPTTSVKPASNQETTTKPVIAPVATPNAERRPTGRPRKKACTVCGQMSCEHKARQSKVAPNAPVEVTPPQETFGGQPVKIVDGKRIVDMPNGVRYRIDRRTVQYKDGTIKEEDVPVELGRPLLAAANAKPYPSPDEAIAIAVAETQATNSKIAANPLMGAILKAAQTGPERESYIPTPPQKKR